MPCNPGEISVFERDRKGRLRAELADEGSHVDIAPWVAVFNWAE